MPRSHQIHKRANIYLFEKVNRDGFIECDNCPYPLIPKVPPMKRAVSVHHSLANAVDDAYVFAIARSYMAEKFLRLKSLGAVHMSVLQVEKEINPHHLQAFNDARVYFGLPSCYLYRDTAISRMAHINGMAVNRLDYDGTDGDTPPAYSQYAAATQLPIRPHCHTCTCTTHSLPTPPETPAYEVRDEFMSAAPVTPRASTDAEAPSPTPTLTSRATSFSSGASSSPPLTPLTSPALSSESMDASPLGLTVTKQRRSIVFWR